MSRPLRDAIRQLRRNPSLSLTVVAIMALCIGSCVAVFGMVKAVLLTDWMYADAGRIAILWHARPNVPGVIGMSPSDFQSYRASLQTIDGLGVVTTRGFNLGGGGTPSRVTCARMTAGMFPMLGVAPRQGRWFTEREERDASPVIVLSDRLWLSEFHGDSSAIDREIALDAVPRKVIGIMPAGFAFPPDGIQGLANADCWIPASHTPAELAVPSFNHVVFGRLKAGVSWEQAAADAHAGAQRIWSTYPAAVQSQIQLTARVVPLVEQSLGRAWVPLALFTGSVVSLLLIGCANAANLLLASYDSRRPEIAIRLSLGATRASVMTQLLCESITLAALGSVAGAAIAQGLLAAMVAANATAFPRLAEARVDMSALGVSVLCALVAGILGGVVPALAAGDHERVSREPARSVARGFAGNWWRRALIGVELALAVVVLVLSAFLARSVWNLGNVATGMEARGVGMFSIALPDAAYRRADQIAAFRDQLIEKLERLPGVHGVAVSSAPPVGEAAPAVVVPAGSPSAADYRPAASYVVTASFARALGLTVKSGRFFDASDPGTTPVAVLNESLARTMWPGGDAIGREIMMLGHQRPMTVVGIVGDVRQGGPLRPAAPAVYQLMSQVDHPVRSQHFVMQSSVPPSRLGNEVRRAVASVDPAIPVFALRSLEDSVAATMAVHRFNTLVVGVFAAFAIALALSGLYAVLAHSVQRARRDFGIRQALGASRARIIGTVVSQVLWPAAIGVAAGALAAMSASELIASLLFGVQPNDLSTIAMVVVATAIACVAAVLVPASRASRSDPALLLRAE